MDVRNLIRFVSSSAIGLISLTVLSACGMQTTSSLMGGKEPVPLFVAMGGNTSCKDADDRYNPRLIGLYRPLESLMERLKNERSVPSKSIVSCYDDTATVYFNIEGSDEVLTGTPEEFAESIQNFMTEESSLMLIGHSYGGWLTMKTAATLANNDRLTGVFTVDPISRRDCSFSNPSGCTSAPRDFTAAQLNDIKERSQIWSNYWQNQTFYLHSSPITQADNNVKVATSHSNIDAHQATWQHIEQGVHSVWR
jgi:hypothetical protein